MAIWAEDLHPRASKGSPEGGRFVAKGGWALDEGDYAEMSRYRTFGSHEQALDLAEFNDFDDAEDDAIQRYAGWESSALNGALRGQVKMDDQHLELQKTLDGIMKRASFPEDAMVYRFFERNGRFAKTLRKLQPGDILTDAGFMSTSATAPDLGQFRDQMKILVPKGSRAVMIGDVSAFKAESEVLIDRGSKLQFMGEDKDGSRVFRLRQDTTLTSKSNAAERPVEPVTIPVGLGLPDGSVLKEESGASAVPYDVAETAVHDVTEMLGFDDVKTNRLAGGWTDPSDGTYYEEQTLVTEVDNTGDTGLAAEAIGEVLGPQREIWEVKGGDNPNARDLRLDVFPTKGVAASKRISDIARGVDPELFSGFTETVDAKGRKGIAILVKDGLVPPKRAEMQSVMIETSQFSKAKTEVLINPTYEDMVKMGKDRLRVMRDDTGNLYAWDAYDAVHEQMIRALGLSQDEIGYNNTDIWNVRNGKLVSRTDGERPKRWVDETHAVAKGPASVADKADVGLLNLCEALDKAGIETEILPSAVTIEKHIADEKGGKTGYPRVKQQAGMAFAKALNAYRDGLAAKLRGDNGADAALARARAAGETAYQNRLAA